MFIDLAPYGHPLCYPCSRRDQTSVQCASPKRRVPPRPRPRRRQRSHWIWTVPRDSWNNWCRFGVSHGKPWKTPGRDLKKWHHFSIGGLNQPSSMAYEYDGTRDVDAFDATFSKLKYDSVTCTYCRYMGKKKLKQKTWIALHSFMDARWCFSFAKQRAFRRFGQETHQALVRDGIINGESGNVPSATRLKKLWVFPSCWGSFEKVRRSGNVPQKKPFFGTTGPTVPVLWCVVRILPGAAPWINDRGT